ncbi:MAG: hypothetical protein M3T49_10570, partial [Candidatus Eremiobacteraeota bacterium]|nr:hypothetical protein [Candidatus Eremiobacteraeota bacterium]
SLARQPALSGPGPPPGRSGLALRPTRATSAPSPPSGDLAPLAGFSAGDSAFGEPAVQADDNARWLLQPFLGARGVAQAVVGAIILEPCAAHKGMGHEPFDW